MKNLIDTKKSLVTALSRYGRVLSLMIVGLALSSGAWATAKTMYIDCSGISGITAMTKDFVQSQNNTQNPTVTISNYVASFDFDFNYNNCSTADDCKLKYKFKITVNGNDYYPTQEQLTEATIGATNNAIVITRVNNNFVYTYTTHGPASHDETTATVRQGAVPTVTPGTGAEIHAYLALQGCHGGASATVSKITAYYSTSEPTTSSAHVDLSYVTFTQGNSYNITIPAAKLDALGAGVTVRVKLSATNDNTSGTQESALSDEIRFTWAGCTPPENPVITEGSATSVCYNNTITLHSNTASTKWYIGDTYKATGDTYTTDALTSATTVVAKAFSSETCMSSGTSITISINNVPAQPGEISGTSTLCANQTYPNQFSITALVPAPTSYTWTVVSGNLTVNGNGTQCSVTTAADFSGGQIQVVATNGCGNSTPRTLDLTKTGEPVIELSATPAASVCSGNDVTISVTAQNVTTHTWSTTSGWTQKSSSISQAVYTTAGTTAQTITYTGTNVCGVSNSANIEITPKEIPSLTIAAPVDACGAGEITFTSSNVTEGATVSWYEGSTFLADGPSYTYNDVAAGSSKTVRAKATLEGCESAFTATVTGTRKVTPSITITLESSAITAGEAGKTYIWEEAIFTPNPSGGDVTYKAISHPTGTGKYIQVTDGNILKVKGQTAGDVFRATYVATGSNGCAANATKDVTIMKYEESCD